MVRKLNDILDLNEGEKEMMNMWNEYIHDVHGRCLLHVNAIVNSFIEQRAHVIFQRNLYRYLQKSIAVGMSIVLIFVVIN